MFPAILPRQKGSIIRNSTIFPLISNLSLKDTEWKDSSCFRFQFTLFASVPCTRQTGKTCETSQSTSNPTVLQATHRKSNYSGRNWGSRNWPQMQYFSPLQFQPPGIQLPLTSWKLLEEQFLQVFSANFHLEQSAAMLVPAAGVSHDVELLRCWRLWFCW